MKCSTLGVVTAAVMLCAIPVKGNSLGPTLCNGSWDGVGLTACELIGEPGDIGKAIDFTGYQPVGTVLWSITARPNGVLIHNGVTLSYANGYDVFTTNGNPKQFAYWESENSIIVGVEDLTGPSDWDYNDWVVRYNHIPDGEQFSNVPEPTGLAVFGMALLGTVHRFFHRK